LVGSENSAMPVAISRAPNSACVVDGEVFSPRKRLTPLGASRPHRPRPMAFCPSMNEICGVTAGAARTRSVARVMDLPPGRRNVFGDLFRSYAICYSLAHTVRLRAPSRRDASDSRFSAAGSRQLRTLEQRQVPDVRASRSLEGGAEGAAPAHRA
jgi:hypothetical protein